MHHFDSKPCGLPYDILGDTNINILAFKINYTNFTKINTFKMLETNLTNRINYLGPKW